MLEMLEIVKVLLLLVSLLYFAWQDYHTRYISVTAAIMVGIIGIAIRLLIEGSMAVILEVFASMALGLGLIILAIATKESIGIGDGVMFLVTGCYLTLFENIILFGRTIFLTGGFAVLCLLIKKLEKGSRIPLAPFMLAGYVTILAN